MKHDLYYYNDEERIRESDKILGPGYSTTTAYREESLGWVLFTLLFEWAIYGCGLYLAIHIIKWI